MVFFFFGGVVFWQLDEMVITDRQRPQRYPRGSKYINRNESDYRESESEKERDVIRFCLIFNEFLKILIRYSIFIKEINS